MKPRIRMLLILCLLLLIATGSAAAASGGTGAAFDGLPVEHTGQGFTTVLTDGDGTQYALDGVLALEEAERQPQLASVASYRLLWNGHILLDAELHQPQSQISTFAMQTTRFNGYYAIDFALSAEDSVRCFLTGLTADNMDSVQETLVNSRLEDYPIVLEDMDFIDAEKSLWPNDGDSELCWAASVANMLHYTGWGQAAGFETADDLLDLYRDSFTDYPGNQFLALLWFFNGLNLAQDIPGVTPYIFKLSAWPQVKEDYGTGSGSYLPEYSANCTVECCYYQRRNFLQRITVRRSTRRRHQTLGTIRYHGKRRQPGLHHRCLG